MEYSVGVAVLVPNILKLFCYKVLTYFFSANCLRLIMPCASTGTSNSSQPRLLRATARHIMYDELAVRTKLSIIDIDTKSNIYTK